MIVQIAGCIEEDEQITPFVADEDAEFWSVYLGEPGSFECIKDFDNRQDAVVFALRLLGDGRAYKIDNLTFSRGDYRAR